MITKEVHSVSRTTLSSLFYSVTIVVVGEPWRTQDYLKVEVGFGTLEAGDEVFGRREEMNVSPSPVLFLRVGR